MGAGPVTRLAARKRVPGPAAARAARVRADTRKGFTAAAGDRLDKLDRYGECMPAEAVQKELVGRQHRYG